LRRRPEIARRRAAENLSRLASLQVAITRQAATRVRDGGRLVLSVCSVLREEAEEVVAALAEPQDGTRLEPVAFEAPPIVALSDGAATVRLLPHVHGTDGYFLASFLVRNARPELA
jgi:16S rRNA (cytosine967-C5)-methyltransferase